MDELFLQLMFNLLERFDRLFFGFMGRAEVDSLRGGLKLGNLATALAE